MEKRSDIWWQRSPTEFDRFKREIEEFESLHFAIRDDKIEISGTWAVFGATALIARYGVRIEVPDDFPDSPPLVFETEGRIPKNPDFHFNDDGSACLFAPPERYEKWPPGSGIREFLKGPVKEFFFSQTCRVRTGEWPFGEWLHGDLGVFQYYAQSLGIWHPFPVEECVRMALSSKLHRQWKCPCGSGKRVTACHAEKIRFLSRILPKDELEKALQTLPSVRHDWEALNRTKRTTVKLA